MALSRVKTSSRAPCRKTKRRKAKAKAKVKKKIKEKIKGKEKGKKTKNPALNPRWTKVKTKALIPEEGAPPNQPLMEPTLGAPKAPTAAMTHTPGKEGTESSPIESHNLFVGKERSVIDGAIYGVLNHWINAIEFNAMTEKGNQDPIEDHPRRRLNCDRRVLQRPSCWI